jgi:ubiquinone/menaquinone biosynthesis C-methylase UbiE
MSGLMERCDFALMRFVFLIRDRISPRKEILEEAKIREGNHVLDYGCGTGSYIPDTLRMVGPDGLVIAIDMNPKAIELATAIGRKRGAENLDTIQTSCATGLVDGSIDVVLFYDVYHSLREPDQVVLELHRVLKQDGLLSFSDHHLREGDIRKILSGGGLFTLVNQGRNTYLFRKKTPEGTKKEKNE